MPTWLQYVNSANPLGYFLVIVNGVVLKDMSFPAVLERLWPLAVLGCVTLTMAAWLFRRRLEELSRRARNSAKGQSLLGSEPALSVERRTQPSFVADIGPRKTCSCSTMVIASSGVKTIGNRLGFLARTTSWSPPKSCCNTSR